jgi:hypothetical protein
MFSPSLRIALVAAAAFMAPQYQSSSFAQSDKIETSDALAKTAAYFMTLKAVCPKWFDIDKDLADKGGKNTFARGVDLFGEEYFQKKVLEQSVLLSKAYEKAGAKDWCAEEKGTTKQMGFKLFR